MNGYSSTPPSWSAAFTVTTAGGGTFKVVVDTSVRLIDKDPDAANAHLILDRLDIPAGNSVIHTINRVLRPINLP